MTRSELIRRLWERNRSMKRKDVEHLTVALVDRMAGAIAKGRRVEFRGFGGFTLRKRKPRVARNPRTGQRVWVDVRHIVHFKPGLAMREIVDASSRSEQLDDSELNSRSVLNLPGV